MGTHASYEETKALADAINLCDCGDVTEALGSVIRCGIKHEEADFVSAVLETARLIAARRKAKRA